MTEPGGPNATGESAVEEQQRRHLGEEDGGVVDVVDGEEQLEDLDPVRGRQRGDVMAPSQVDELEEDAELCENDGLLARDKTLCVSRRAVRH